MTNPRSTVEVARSSTTVGFGFTGRPPFRRKRTFSKPPRVSFRFLKFSRLWKEEEFFFSRERTSADARFTFSSSRPVLAQKTAR
jgi:hypothetical protein